MLTDLWIGVLKWSVWILVWSLGVEIKLITKITLKLYYVAKLWRAVSTYASGGVGTETLPYPTTPKSLFEVLGIRML